ncbi:DUF6484 domain-containing protein [Ideonella sp.]|uniref:DUF6484 domain-containing protein n=1 Tax=Ideonella sp. TaxID=1929293 RepID=UPI00351B6210
MFAPTSASRAAVASPSAALVGGMAVVGRLHGFAADESPLISNLVCAPGRVVAGRTTVSLRSSMRGLDVVVLFENGDVDRPIVVGVIGGDALQQVQALPAAALVEIDGERRVISAEREIVLRCGSASITLTRAGKIVICGTYLVSRSTGPNKIKGGSIDLN